jgi:signal transduction histidine kinase
MRDGVLVVNRDREIALANRAMEEILGVETGALLRRQVASVLSGSVLAPALAAFDPANPAPAAFEADAAPRRLFVTVSGFYDDGGGLLGRIVTAVDISTVKRIALEKARFTRMLVHELRAPLNALKSIVEVLQDRSLGSDLGPYASFLDRANERIDGLSLLISDLLSLSRIEHEGAVQAPAAPSSVGAVVAEVVELWRDKAAAASVTIEINVAPDLPACSISAEDLTTILVNLVGNAVKYNRSDGKVTVSATRSAGGVEVAVRDTGIGIEAQNLSRLGEEFFREKRRETRGVKGNGLGLAIVKRLVDRAGGRLCITSTPGAGSDFRTVFPC